MTKKARQEIVSVIEYFGGIGDTVSPVAVKRYISRLLDSPIDLPLHYQLKIDDLLREDEIDRLLAYLTDTLGSSIFLIDGGKYFVKGFKHLVRHPQASELLDFLEDKAAVESFILENYGLHPLLIRTEVMGNEVGLVIKDFGNKALGILGPLSLDFELAVGLLNYLEI